MRVGHPLVIACLVMVVGISMALHVALPHLMMILQVVVLVHRLAEVVSVD